MFDIYEFFNSKDFAKYLKEIDYKFMPLEKAWLVFQSDSKHYADKKKALEEITKTSDDFLIKKRPGLSRNVMFHSALKDYINYKDNIAEQLKIKQDGCVYSYRLKIKDDAGQDYGWSEGFTIFSNFEEIQNICKDEINKCKDFYDFYKITKTKIDSNLHEDISGYFDKDGDVIDVFQQNDECYDPTVVEFFESLWFAFPYPFKKGDIVCTKNSRPYIFDNCSCNKDDEKYEYYLEHGCCENMHFTAYEITDKGRLWHCQSSFYYTDAEYYKGDCEKGYELLKTASKYIKGEIPLDVCVNTYIEDYVKKLKLDLKSERLKL